MKLSNSRLKLTKKNTVKLGTNQQNSAKHDKNFIKPRETQLQLG